MGICRIFLVIGLFSSVSWAAIPSKNLSQSKIEKKLLQKDIDAALMALRLPPSNRKQALKHLEPKTFDILVHLSQRKNLSLTSRWRAVTQLGANYPQRARSYLLKLSRSPKWFYRNSSLLSLKISAPKLAVAVSERMLLDPALVVRTAAVQTLTELNSKKSVGKLWKSLDSQINFRKGKSLWVRAHIMEAIAQFASKKDLNRFARYLNDQDPKVQALAIRGIERVTGTGQQYRGVAFQERRALWKSKLL